MDKEIPPFIKICSICKKQFVSRISKKLLQLQMKRHHEGTHKLGFLYSCNYLFCNYSTYRKSDFKRHRNRLRHYPVKTIRINDIWCNQS